MGVLLLPLRGHIPCFRGIEFNWTKRGEMVMAKHRIKMDLAVYWRRAVFYLRRWLRRTMARLNRRSYQPGKRQTFFPYLRLSRVQFYLSRRVLSQLYGALFLVIIVLLVATHPLQTGELLTKTVQGTVNFSLSGMRWVQQELIPGILFSFQADQEMPVRILDAGLPTIDPDNIGGLDLLTMAKKLVSTVTDINLNQMESILEAQFLGSDFELPAHMTERAPDPALLDIEVQPQIEVAADIFSGDKPLIAIYHTHSSEAYHGRNEHLKGEAFYAGDYCWGETKGVISVGDQLAKILAEEYKIPVVHSRKIHDYPVFRDAYTNSKLTLTNILREYPSVEMVIDLHRDGLARPPEEVITTTVAGERLARVAIIVGRGQKGFMNSHWQQNEAFAKQLHQTMEDMYPGLSRGVLIKDWPYNQELHPRAVLLEVGDHFNTRTEALKAAHLVADVLAAVLRQSRGGLSR